MEVPDFLAGKIGLGFASVHVSASPVWAPAGMAVALLLLLGFSIWPAILAGAFLVNITTTGGVLTSASIAVGNTLEGILAAWLLQRFAHGVHAFESPPDILKSALLAGLLSPIVSATIGVTSLVLGQYALLDEYPIIWLTWWLGDGTGMLIVTPAILLWAKHPRIEWNRRERVELGLLFLVLLVTCEVIFGPLISTTHKYPLQFLLVPILIWAAFHFGPRETATLTVLMAGWATWGTINGRGPFTSESENEALLLGQAFLVVNTVMALALAAAMQESKDADARFHETAERLVNKSTEQLLHTQARLRTMAQALTLTEQRERKRILGRQLLSITLTYISLKEGGEDLLDRARAIGCEHALDGLQMGLSLVEALRIILFFRDTMYKVALELPDVAHVKAEVNAKLLRRIGALLATVELSVAETYDQAYRSAALQQSVPDLADH